MKKLTLIILAAFAAFSCNDALELPNDGRLTMEQIFSSADLTAGYLNMCYSYMPYGGHVGDYSLSYGGTLLASYSDEAWDSRASQTGLVQNWYTGNATVTSFPLGDWWSPYYEGIRYCNTYLANADNVVKINPLAEGDILLGKAQALVLRSFYLLQVIRRYGPAPIVTEPMDDVTDYSTWTRSSVRDCAEAIIVDCNKAVDEYGLEWMPGVSNNVLGTVTCAMAYAIQSQAALLAASPLWNKGSDTEVKDTWKWAAVITGNALNTCLANDYKLYSEAPSGGALVSSQSAYQSYHFGNIYSYDRIKDKETIYQCRNQLTLWRDSNLPFNSFAIRSGVCPTQEFVDAFEMADGTSPFLMDEDGCVLYTGVNPQPNPAAAATYDPANPYAGRDPRLDATVFYNGSLWNYTDPASKAQIYQGGNAAVSATNERYTRTGYYLRKFHYNQSNAGNSADGYMKLFRLAELYLNFAECANEGYGPSVQVSDVTGSVRSAMVAVNAVRTRANMPAFPAGMSIADFRKKYRNERRIELSFEQHRFYDVRRWEILGKTDKQLTGMNVAPVDLTADPQTFNYASGRFSFTQRQCSADKFLLFPLPRAEASKMESFTGTRWQNPQW